MHHLHSATHLFLEADGSVTFNILPNSFAFIEARVKQHDPSSGGGVPPAAAK
jgi:hypothetical protein